MRQLVYRSAAVVPFDAERLRVLLVRAREFNNARGVTGILLHHRGMFAQCLEGPAEQVDIVWQRIMRDPTHRDLLLLQNLRTQQRSFGAWSMACTELTAPEWQAFEAGTWDLQEVGVHTPGLVIMQSLWSAYRQAAEGG